jgi:hypothetical protein
LIVIVVGVLGFLVYFFYRKFVVTKEILKYEVSDVRNVASIPKSLSELKTINSKREGQKYANLTEEASQI